MRIINEPNPRFYITSTGHVNGQCVILSCRNVTLVPDNEGLPYIIKHRHSARSRMILRRREWGNSYIYLYIIFFFVRKNTKTHRHFLQIVFVGVSRCFWLGDRNDWFTKFRPSDPFNFITLVIRTITLKCTFKNRVTLIKHNTLWNKLNIVLWRMEISNFRIYK